MKKMILADISSTCATHWKTTHIKQRFIDSSACEIPAFHRCRPNGVTGRWPRYCGCTGLPELFRFFFNISSLKTNFVAIFWTQYRLIIMHLSIFSDLKKKCAVFLQLTALIYHLNGVAATTAMRKKGLQIHANGVTAVRNGVTAAQNGVAAALNKLSHHRRTRRGGGVAAPWPSPRNFDRPSFLGEDLFFCLLVFT